MSRAPAWTATVLTTRVHRIWLSDEGIVHAAILPGSELTRADSEAGVAAIWEASGHRRRPLVLDSRGLKSLDRGARLHSADPLIAGVILAFALLVGSPLTLTIAGLFMAVNKPPVPGRVFTVEAEALAWLRRFLE